MRRLARLLASVLLILPLAGLAWTAGSALGQSAPIKLITLNRVSADGSGPSILGAVYRATATGSRPDGTSTHRWQSGSFPSAGLALAALLAVPLLLLGPAITIRSWSQASGPGWLPAERAPPLLA
jgi:hypothetical protein